jgi:protein-S-isoprenylcysteine O-methyltransferase Ste14
MWDLFSASPLIAWYLLTVWGILTLVATEIRTFDPHDLQVWGKIVSQLSSLAYIGMIILVFVVRHLPLTKAYGAVPRIVAITASNAQLSFFLLPRATLSLPAEIASLSLVSAGAIASAWILIWLRGAFSILPQARALITAGPYLYIRHPLYAAEGIASIGLMLQFLQPLAVAITIAGFALQILRMDYEERVLSETFPEYAMYKKRTFRILPGIY